MQKRMHFSRLPWLSWLTDSGQLRPQIRLLAWLSPLLILHALHLHPVLILLWFFIYGVWHAGDGRSWRWVVQPGFLLMAAGLVTLLFPPKSVSFQVSLLYLLTAVVLAHAPWLQAPRQLGSPRDLRWNESSKQARQATSPSTSPISGLSLVAVVFLTGCLFLLSRDIVVLFFACVWLICFLFFAVSANFNVTLASVRFRASTVGWLLVAASLGAAGLFLVIPRIPMAIAGPVAFAPPQSVSGVSQELDFSQLGPVSLNSVADYAVRVQAGHLPRQPYWKVYTLSQFNGRRWTPSPLALRAQQAELAKPVLEKSFVFAQDGPKDSALRYSVQSLRPLGQPMPRLETPQPMPKALGPVASPALWKWAQESRQQYASDNHWLQMLLQEFRSQFLYDLNSPSSAAQDPLADFFFNQRRGYCSHFAAALAELLRANNIPVQIISGYLGADYNASGGFYTLRQSQAHVWLEASLDGQAPIQIDPTLGVAPAPGSLSPAMIQAGFESSVNPNVYGNTLTSLRAWRYRLEAWRAAASREFMAIGYDSSGPGTSLWSRLGLQDFSKVLIFFSLCFLVVVFGVWQSSRAQGSRSMTAFLMAQLVRGAGGRVQPDKTETTLQFVTRWGETMQLSDRQRAGLIRLAQGCMRFDFAPPVAVGPRANRRRWKSHLKKRLAQLSV